MTAVDAIKERLPVTEVVGQRVRLAKSGRYLKGLCPFHSEKTPSFFVFPETNTFKCFGCGEGGDVFSFVMKTQRLEFRDALVQLAEEAGVELPTRRESGSAQIKEILSANAAAAAYFRRMLTDDSRGENARAYVDDRGLSEPVLEKFKVGYVPDGWDNLISHLLEIGIAPEIALKAGLSKEGDRGPYDTFRDRLMFPIANRKGDVIGFGGRALGDDPAKYLNTPRTPAFDKGATLYALNRAHEAIAASKTVIVVEGYTDAITAHQFEYENVVASMGTAVTAAQLNLLRSSADRLIMCLDSDAAGVAATRRGLEMLGADPVNGGAVPSVDGLIQHQSRFQTEVHVASLPPGSDPDDIIRRDRELWKTALDQAIPLAEYLFTSTTTELDLTTLRGRNEAIDRLAPIIRGIVQPVVRAQYVNALSRLLKIPEEDIHLEVRKRQRRNLRPREQAEKRPELELDDYLLARGLSNRTYLGRVLEELDDEDFKSVENRLLARFLSRIDATVPTVEADEEREALEPALLDRLDSAEKLRHRLPPLEGEALYSEMRSMALRLRRDRFRAENRRIQVLLSEHRSGLETAELGKWQSRILVEMRDIEVALRRLGATHRALKVN